MVLMQKAIIDTSQYTGMNELNQLLSQGGKVVSNAPIGAIELLIL
ncbi:MAG: hypothetical protein ACFFCZ_27140 [Promethearchaeota archaeon]